MLFNKQDCGGASSAPFTLEPTTVPSVTDNPLGRGAMASGVHAANRATGSRTLPFKSSAFICHPWFLPTIHIPNHGPPGVDAGLEDESPLFPIRTDRVKGGVHSSGESVCSSITSQRSLTTGFVRRWQRRRGRRVEVTSAKKKTPKKRREKNSKVLADQIIQTFVAHSATCLWLNDSQGVFSSRSNEKSRAPCPKEIYSL